MKAKTEKQSIRFAIIDTRIGPICVAVSDNGVVRIKLNAASAKKLARDLAGRFDCIPIFKPRDPLIRRAANQLKEYAEGKRRSFSLPLDLRETGFRRRVLKQVAKIPFGKVATYGDIARKVGNPKAARAVGGAVGSNPIPIIIPCHRVVAVGGKLGGFGGGLPLKKKLLALETGTYFLSEKRK